MKPIKLWPLLPHELVFGFFLLLTWSRLAAATGLGSSSSLFYGALILLNAGLIAWCRKQETPGRWRLRLLFYPVAMNLIFTQMKVSVPLIHPQRLDACLQGVDAWLVGRNLCLRLEPFVQPALTELFSFCYFLFFPYLLFSLIYYFCGELELLKKFVVGLFCLYGLGFIGYSFVPAQGPYLDMAGQFKVPLHGWWITRWNAEAVRLGSNGVDVFPSLHCAVSSYFLFFDRQHRPWRFKLYLLPCVGLWISTIYLRYHYFIDLVCGFTLAALALGLANQFSPKPAASDPTPGAFRFCSLVRRRFSKRSSSANTYAIHSQV